MICDRQRSPAMNKTRKTKEPDKEKQHTIPLSERLAFTIQEVAETSALGQTSIYKAIGEKQLVARKYGTRTLITKAALSDFLSKLSRASEK